MTPFLRSLVVDLAIACVCSAALLSLLGSTSPRLVEREQAHAEAVRGIRTVADRELVFAREHAPPDEVRRSVASVQSFVARRAGVSLDPKIVDRLADLEQRTLDGRLRRLTVDEVSAAFSEVLCERIRGLSDDELASTVSGFDNVMSVGRLEQLGDDVATRDAVARRLRGAPAGAAKLPEGAYDRVQLRFDGSGSMAADAFAEKLREFRDRLRSPQILLLAETQGRGIVEDYLDERLALMETSLPESWGEARSRGLTPVQVFLEAYSAASDDALVLTTDRLAEQQEYFVERHLPAAKVAVPAERRAPFGRYGDLFSTPLDVGFDPGTLGRLLDAIEERGSR